MVPDLLESKLPCKNALANILPAFLLLHKQTPSTAALYSTPPRAHGIRICIAPRYTPQTTAEVR